MRALVGLAVFVFLVAWLGAGAWSTSDDATAPGRLAIVGPAHLSVGRPAEFTVEPGADSADAGRVEWFVDGEPAARGLDLRVTPAQPGTMELEVVVAGDENDVGSGPIEVEVEAEGAIERGDASGGPGHAPDGAAADTDELDLEPDEPEVEIEGPQRITLGDEVTYTAAVPEGTPISWIDGEGRRHRTPQLVFTPSRTGIMTFRLSAEIEGRYHIVTRTVTVVES
ncbi:MAG: hypothetical protein S0880_29835 [Actinomycetota bacterium]|nr:hypothetical protein [Actinomycetota bacterium]